MFQNCYAATMSKKKKLDNFHLYRFVSLHFIWNSNTVVITVLEEEMATEPSKDNRQNRGKGNLAASEDRN